MKTFTLTKDMAWKMRCVSLWERLQYLGLEAAGFRSKLKQLPFGGDASYQIDGEPFTGQKSLILNNGGLRNKEASTSLKKLFVEKIKPLLMNILTPLDKNLNGKLMLHFSEGTLQRIYIETR